MTRRLAAGYMGSAAARYEKANGRSGALLSKMPHQAIGNQRAHAVTEQRVRRGEPWRQAFRQHIHQREQVYEGFFSQSAIATRQLNGTDFYIRRHVIRPRMISDHARTSVRNAE